MKRLLCILFGHEAAGLMQEDYARDVLYCWCRKKAVTRMQWLTWWAR